MYSIMESEMFNQMADFYDKFRPSYPLETINSIVKTADLTPGSQVLEIGAGSGKATEQFAAYGFEMLCMDPGEDLVHKGNERFRDQNITFVATRFENYALPHAHFDAIVAAQSFHWIPKPQGYSLCASTLKKHGWLMPFWNIELIYDTELDQDLLSILEKHSAFTATMKTDDYNDRVERISKDIAASGYFYEPQITQTYWEKIYTAEEYFGYVMTGNVFIRNPDSTKSACFHDLCKLADKYNGIRRRFVCELYASQKIL